ncbi:ribosome recycling factor [Patescibacteria group bacterium]
MIDEILTTAREKMRKSFEVTKEDLSTIRSGRAAPSIIENIVISAYEGTQKLKLMEMATISSQDAKTLLIAPYDPSQVVSIEKSILEARVGLTPIVDGDIIRIVIPGLSQERRIEYIKLAKVKLESGRVMIRQVRQEAMKDLKKAGEEGLMTEDEQKVGEKKTQELTDEIIAEIDAMGKKKEEELMRV